VSATSVASASFPVLVAARASEQPALENGGDDGNWQKVSRR
jgi:hypothetical protein